VDSNGLTPLSNAVQLGSVNAVSELLRQGGDPVIRDRWGLNCLHRAVIGERVEIFKKIVGCANAPLMAKICDNRRNYPIHYALKSGLTEMVIPLLEMTSEWL